MRLKPGDVIIPIQLPGIDGTPFDLNDLKGKAFMLCFFRFASCPFCNLRVHELVKRYAELADNFPIVAIFDSPLNNLKKHTSGHQAPFAILADETNQYYRTYAIEHSVLGMLKGMLTRFPTLIKGMLKGYIPLIPRGRITTMPADFLIDAKGLIQTTYYGKDEGDHLSFETVKSFSQNNNVVASDKG